MNRDQASHANEHGYWVKRGLEVKKHIKIEDVIGAVVTLKKAGANLLGFCPFHANTDTPAFMVHKGKQFMHCFGCAVNGDVIKFAMLKEGLSYSEAVQSLETKHGIARLVATPVKPVPKIDTPQVMDRRKLERAQQIWDRSTALTPACPPVPYLTARAIVRPSSYGICSAEVNDGWTDDVRYVERCWHDFERKNFPAMVAPIRAYDGTLLTVHQTYLMRRPDGLWTKANIAKAKMVVGSYGPGYIRLGEAADKMVGGEGIETTFSAMQLYKRPGLVYVTAGRMKSIEPPFLCSDYLIAADKGAPSAEKKKWGEEHAKEGARRFSQGRTVRVVIPKIAADKGDFNDLVREMAGVA